MSYMIISCWLGALREPRETVLVIAVKVTAMNMEVDMRNTRNHVGWRGALAGVVLLLSGCMTNPFEPVKLHYQDELGTVHVTLFPPLHYDAYRDDLQPVFKMDTEKALQMAMPTTQRMAAARRSEQTYGLSISNAGAPQDFSTEKASSLNVKAEGNVEMDPFLWYSTALSLYQEVHLLSRLFKDIGIDDNYEPYIVRLEVACMPKVKRAPYDAVVDIVFSPVGDDGLPATNAMQIIPCLVTDNVEARFSELSDEKIVEMAAKVAATIKSVSVGAEARAKSQFMKSVLGNEYNSLLTVGRLSDNTLRVRLGAMHDPGSGYAAVPRTHKITLLALIKRDIALRTGQTLNAISCVRYYDSADGSQLYTRDAKKIADLVRRWRQIGGKGYVGFCREEEKDFALNLFSAFGNSDYCKFKRIVQAMRKREGISIGSASSLKENKSQDGGTAQTVSQASAKSISCATMASTSRSSDGDSKRLHNGINISPLPERDDDDSLRQGDNNDPDNRNRLGVKAVPSPEISTKETNDIGVNILWLDVANILSSSAYDFTSVGLPKALGFEDCKIGTAGFAQTSDPLTVLDNGTVSEVHIRNVGRPKTPRFQAVLEYPKVDGAPFLISASSVAADSNGTGLVLEFPSAINWTEQKPVKLDLFWVELSGKAGGAGGKPWTFGNLNHTLALDKDLPTVQLVVVGPKSISRDPQNGGMFRLKIDKWKTACKEDVLVYFDANVKAIQPNGVLELQGLSNNGKVLTNGVVEVALEGLCKGQEISVIAKTKSGRELSKITDLKVGD